jgi:hypothetical protein
VSALTIVDVQEHWAGGVDLNDGAQGYLFYDGKRRSIGSGEFLDR